MIRSVELADPDRRWRFFGQRRPRSRRYNILEQPRQAGQYRIKQLRNISTHPAGEEFFDRNSLPIVHNGYCLTVTG